MPDLVYLIIFLIVSLGISLFLFKKYHFFREARGFLSLLAVGIVAAFLHNVIYAFLYDIYFAGTDKDEPVFFIIALLSLGVAFFLFWIWLFSKLKKLVGNKKKK